jgi:RTX calcium-binding nonapeptide repeat (4 copies)
MITTSNLQQALQSAQTTLVQLAQRNDFWSVFTTCFGRDFNRESAIAVRQQLLSKEYLRPVQIVADADMGQALGAYAPATDTIYLQESLVASGNIEAIGAILIEELGHSIDVRVNTQESPGDEGAIFRLFATGHRITKGLLAQLQDEDDWGTIWVAGQELVVEMAAIAGTAGNDTLTSGVDSDVISGLAGNDSIFGGAGNDAIYGGLGNDTIDAGLGNDQIFGGDGSSSSSTDGADNILAGDGNDTVYAGVADTLVTLSR